MREPDEVAAARRDLGRQLAARRQEAGYLQRELGALIGYARNTVANAEAGSPGIGREFWVRADRALGSGELFTRGYERIRAQAADKRPVPGGGAQGVGGGPSAGLESLVVGEALEACLARGWPVEGSADGRLWLVTGAAVDVLEVGLAAGRLAMGWWLFTRGVPDPIRGLPALPDPAIALAAVVVGSRCYFWVAAGACPWAGPNLDSAGGAGPAVVRWHSHGGRVPVPPSRAWDGKATVWAHVPAGTGPLVSPVALLHLLGQAVAAVGDGAGMVLPGGARAVPAVDSLPPAGSLQG